METKKLQELGLSEEQIKEIFAMNGKEVNEFKRKLEEKEAENKSLSDAKTSVEETLRATNEQLETLKGVDIEGIKKSLADAQNELKNQQEAYAREKADREFNEKVDGFISKKGGKNSTAIKSLLKIDDLKNSKNQDADIQTAIDALAQDKDSEFLFASAEPIKNPVAKTSGNPPKGLENVSLLGALKDYYKRGE